MSIIKTIKFDLPIDGVKVKNLEELREHFTVEILELYNNKMLLSWMRSRKMLGELDQLEKKASMELSRIALMKVLCEIFKIDADDMIIAAALGMPPEKIAKNFLEIKAKYKAIIHEEIKAAEAKKPTVSGKYLVYKNGTVTDTKTQLMWKQASETGEYTWDAAMAKFGKNVSFAGYDDWRMPTKEELKTLVDKTHCPTIDPTAFPNTQSTWYWSSTARDTSNAWYVNFSNGNDYWSNRYVGNHVRLVRSGQ